MFPLSQRHFKGKKDNTLVIDNSIISFGMKMPHPMDMPYSLILFRTFRFIKSSYFYYENMRYLISTYKETRNLQYPFKTFITFVTVFTWDVSITFMYLNLRYKETQNWTHLASGEMNIKIIVKKKEFTLYHSC